jgi:hypothetical protein
MASVVTQELEETVSDSTLNAWFDGSGYKNLEKRAWTFGTTGLAANGPKFSSTMYWIAVSHAAALGECEWWRLPAELIIVCEFSINRGR